MILGIDLGGTNIKAVLLNEQMEVVEEQSVPTNDQEGRDDGLGWKKSVREMVRKFQRQHEGVIEVVGMSAPGLADVENRCIAYLPNKMIGIEQFVCKDWLGIDTYILNDAHAALVAESEIGAGRPYQDIVLLTLGTGVGGGVMIGGKLLQGQQGRAGHFGHMSVNRNYDPSIVGSPGSLENAIGECTVAERTYGHYPTTHQLVEAHKQGETFATYVWLNSVEQLCRGITSLIYGFSPEVVIIGGGITKAGDALMGPLNDLMEVYEWRPAHFKTPIVLAEMGGNAGAIGAALFAKRHT